MELTSGLAPKFGVLSRAEVATMHTRMACIQHVSCCVAHLVGVLNRHMYSCPGEDIYMVPFELSASWQNRVTRLEKSRNMLTSCKELQL